MPRPEATRARRAALGTTLAALLLLAACSSIVEGTPTAAGRSSTTTSSSAAPTTTSSAPTTTDSGTAGELSCSGDNAVLPEGQPFCFTKPDGFRIDDVSIDNEAGSSASYTSGLLLSQRDVIVFSVYDLNINTDDLSDQELTDALRPVIDQLSAQGFDFGNAEPDLREVDKARAFHYTGSDAGGLNSDTYFIFRGRTELQVNCQWADMKQVLLAGCDTVLADLQLIG